MAGPTDEVLLRYRGDPSHVLTRRDPFEDLCAWTRGLRSFHYTSDLLLENHKAATDVKAATRAIAAHAENAVDYLDQAIAGPPDISFLPVYYALLNLAKIYVIASGRMSELRDQKLHGASYKAREEAAGELSEEQITVHPKGAIPLFYDVLAESPCPTTIRKVGETFQMGSIYPRVRFVSTEYREACPSARYPFAGFTVVLEDVQEGFRLKVTVNKHRDRGEKIDSSSIHLVDGGSYSTTETGLEYEGPVEFGDRAVILERVVKPIRRQLISSHYDARDKRFLTFTPVGAGPWLWPEEFSILLSFYHLSNVVRYDPEYLEWLKDSKYWLFLYALRSNGPLTFLELFWSFLKRRTLVLRRG